MTAYDETAERAVLGACIIDPDALLEAVDRLTPEMFYVAAHRQLFEVLTEMARRGATVDLVTLHGRLEDRGILHDVKGVSYVAGLADSVVTSANIEHYADRVRERHRRSRIVDAARLISDLAEDGETETEELAERAEREVFAATEERRSTGPRPLVQVSAEHWQRLSDARREGGYTGLPTGYPSLDRMLGGLQPGELTILAARPSQGKTSLAWCIAENAAKRVPVAFFSLEMSAESLAERAIVGRGGIPGWRLRNGMMEPSHWDSGWGAVSDLGLLPIHMDDDGSATTIQVRSRSRRIQARHGLGLIVVDYLQLMGDPREKGESMNDRVGGMVRRLKATARELNVPALVLSQFSRAVEQRGDRLPMLSDLRDSGDIEQAADVVIFIHNPTPKKPESGPRDIIVAKQRNGITGKRELLFIRERTRFEELSQREELA